MLQYYLQSSLGYSPSTSGLMWMIMSGATLFSNLAWGQFSDRYGEKRLVIYGGILRFVALATLAFIPFLTMNGDPFWLLGVILVVFGIGTGITVTPLTSMIVGAFSQADTGMISGVYSMARNIAGSFGILLFAQILTITNLSMLNTSLELSSISISFFLASLISIGGIGFILGVPKNSISDAPQITNLKTDQNVSISE